MEQPQRKPFLINRKRPYTTFVFMGICVLIFVLDYGLRLYFAWKYDIDVSILRAYGMKHNELIKLGQWWRLLSAIFLHGDLTHLGFNMLALYIWGRHIETLYGTWRYIVLFLLAGLLSTAASFAFTAAPSLGASGAIYGLFGALLYFRKYDKVLFNKIFGVQILIYLAFSLFLGFTQPYIDNVGHIGGLIGGYLVAHSVGLLTQRYDKQKSSVVFIVIYVVVFLSCIIVGILK